MERRVGAPARLAALALDLALVSLLLVAVDALPGTPASVPLDEAAMDPADVMASAARGILTTSVVVLLYFLIEGVSGASPGKWLLKLQVGGDDGRFAPLPARLARFTAKLSGMWVILLGGAVMVPMPAVGWMLQLVGNLLLLGIVSGGFLMLGEKRQALHDSFTHTAVYRRGTLAPWSPPGEEPPG